MPSFSDSQHPNTVFEPKKKDPPEITTTPITQDRHQGVQIDTQLIPYGSLLRYVEGRRWQVTYYQQVLDRDTELRPQDLSLSPVNQQYTRINQMEFKVTDDLSYSQDTTTRESSLTGGATLYPPVVPNVGDMFVADVGDGRAGVFQIIDTQRATYRKQSCFTVEYVLVDYATNERLDDFKAKTNQETYFVRSFLEFGENPVIIKSEYARQRDLKEVYYETIYQYLSGFYSQQFRTLLVPEQTTPTYDAFVVKTLLSLFNTNDHAAVQHIRELNISGQAAMDRTTVWDCLLQLSDDMMSLVVQKVGVVPVYHFGHNYCYNGIYFSGIKDVVFPRDGHRAIDDAYSTQRPYPTDSRQLVGQGLAPVEQDEQTPVPQASSPGQALPMIHSVADDDYYVFSAAFYTNDTPLPLSQLEVQVLTALRGEPTDLGILIDLAEASKHWPPLEQFYYVPVILILMKSRLREVEV